MAKERTSAEVKKLIEEARQPFRALDAAERFWQEVEAGTYDYEAKIPDELGEPIVRPRRMVTQRAQYQESIISWPFRVVVSLGAGTQDEGHADEVETDLAHARLRIDPNGEAGRILRHHMVHSRFGAVRLYKVPKNAPAGPKGETAERKKQRIERWEQDYWRWRIEALNPRTVGFTRRDGMITCSVIEEEIPVLDLKQYADDQEISQAFPGLRADDGKSPEDGDSWMQSRITRYIVDDGVTECVYIKQTNRAGRDSDGRFYSGEHYEKVDEAPNTFGCPSVVVYPFVERPHAPIKERYEAGMAPHCEAEFALTMLQGIAMTVSANPMWAEEYPEDVANTLSRLIAAGTDPKTFSASSLGQKDAQGRRTITPLKGTLKSAQSELGEAYNRVWDSVEKEWDELGQGLMMLNPDNMGENTPAAVVYAQLEMGQRLFEKQQDTIRRNEELILRMIAHDVVHGLNPHVATTGSGPNDQSVSYVTLGAETRSKKVAAGEKRVMRPARYEGVDQPGVITLVPVVNSKAQEAAATQLELSLLDRGMSNPERVYQARGVDDATGELEKDAAWHNAQLLGPGIRRLRMVDVIVFGAMRDGRDPELLKAMFMPEEAPPEGGGEQTQTTRGQTYSPPAQPGPPGMGKAA